RSLTQRRGTVKATPPAAFCPALTKRNDCSTDVAAKEAFGSASEGTHARPGQRNVNLGRREDRGRILHGRSCLRPSCPRRCAPHPLSARMARCDTGSLEKREALAAMPRRIPITITDSAPCRCTALAQAPAAPTPFRALQSTRLVRSLSRAELHTVCL